MPTSSFLRLFIHTDKLDGSEQQYWETYINRREHLKREYPEGIPIKVLYPEGLNGASLRHGSYFINPDGEYFVSIPDNRDCLIPGNGNTPVYWYLLFLKHPNYFRNIAEALQSYRSARMRMEQAFRNLHFNLAEEPSTVAFLQKCAEKELHAFEHYLSGEDPAGYLELIYADFGTGLDPLLLDRLDEDRQRMIFPGMIERGLHALESGNRSEAERCFEEIILLEQQYRRSITPETAPAHEWNI